RRAVPAPPKAPARTLAKAPVKAPVEAPVDEVTLLEQARERMSTDPAGARDLAAEHARRFPSGAFSEEREALRIEASARLGEDAEAAQQYRSFERRYPRSPYQRRLRRWVRQAP